MRDMEINNGDQIRSRFRDNPGKKIMSKCCLDKVGKETDADKSKF